MLKLTKTGIGLLTRQYRSVLHKCWLINVGLWQAMGDAVSKAVSVPARLVASLLSGGVLNGEAFNALDEILLSRLFERKLSSLTAIGLVVAAATMPNEANADYLATGSLCYTSGGAVVFHNGAGCATGETRLAIIGPSASDALPGNESMALGINAQATGKGSMAVGGVARAQGVESMALGHGARTTGLHSTALGYDAQALLDHSTALGYSAWAIGEDTTALGSNAQANSSNYSTALGSNAQALGEGSTAIGYQSVANEANTVSVGRFGADSATLAQMKADLDGGMSESDFTTKYAQYNANYQADDLYMFYKYKEADWEEAVEESRITEITRRIINVADGTGDHDAMTIGQLGFDVATYPTVTDYLSNNYYTKLMKKDEKFDTNEGIMDVKSLKKGTNSSQGRIIKGVSAFPSIMCAYPFDMPHTANDNHKSVITRLDRVISANSNDSAEILWSSHRMTNYFNKQTA